MAAAAQTETVPVEVEEFGVRSSYVTKRKLSPLPMLDEGLVLAAFSRAGAKPDHAYKMWRYIIQNGVTDLRDIPELPKAALRVMNDEFVLTTSRVKSVNTSADSSTTKLLVELQDGKLVESVIMRYGCVQLANFPQEKLQKSETGDILFKSNQRATLCISSQVGCSMGCTFCATGTMGLTANLTAGEILEQLYHANQIETIRNVVFMGMGEPLDNYANVISAIR